MDSVGKAIQTHLVHYNHVFFMMYNALISTIRAALSFFIKASIYWKFRNSWSVIKFTNVISGVLRVSSFSD